MMQDPELIESVREWVRAWGVEVAAAQLDVARDRFAPDVVAFGTWAEVAVGLDALHDEQWSRIWPAIEDFAFRIDDDQLVVLASPDGEQAVAVVGWDSVGVAADGARFHRPGRATIVLRRDGSRWLGVHTHFSLAPSGQ